MFIKFQDTTALYSVCYCVKVLQEAIPDQGAFWRHELTYIPTHGQRDGDFISLTMDELLVECSFEHTYMNICVSSSIALHYGFIEILPIEKPGL